MIKSSQRTHNKRSHASPAPSASPAPASSAPDLRIEPDQIVIAREDRQYRIRGLEQNHIPLRLIVR